MMKLIRALAFTFFWILIFPDFSIAGLGNGTSPNPTGGFGSGNNTTTVTTPNPTGGIGTGGGNLLGTTPPPPAPPPPPPVPLDGGAGILIATALGLGVKKIYSEIKRK